MTTASPVPSLIQIENDSLQLAGYLRSEASLEGRRGRFFAFFHQLDAWPDPQMLRSYYVQFCSYLLPLAQGLNDAGRDPEELGAWLELIERFKQLAPEHLSVIEQCGQRICIAAILHACYAADFARAAALAGSEWNPESAPASSRLETARTLAGRAAPPFRDELLSALQSWPEAPSSFSANRVQVLLIDSSTLVAAGADPQGVLLPLHAEARERPSDAEADQALINNRVGTLGQEALHWTLQDALLAARARMPGGTAQRYFTVHYSLQEKSAEISGTSVGLAAALLAWVACRNRHYRAPVARIAADAAVTGGIRPDGSVSLVDSLTLGAKLRAAFFSPAERLFLPAANLPEAWPLLAALEARYPHRHLLLQPLETLQQALQDRNLIDAQPPRAPARVLAALSRTRNKPLRAALAAAAALVLLFAIIPALQWWRDRVPARAEISGNAFIVENRSGQKLWSHHFSVPLTPAKFENNGLGSFLIDDLDGNGRPEVIFALNDYSRPELLGTLFGFDDKGRELWPPLKLSAKLKTCSGLEFEDSYYTGPVHSVQIRPGEPRMILCSIGSIQDYTARLVLADHAGRICGSYWNAGHITDYVAYDINADGRNEIIASMYGNEDGRTRLAAFDPDQMSGASPQADPYYTLADIPPSHPLKLFRFPASPFVEPKAYRDALWRIDLGMDHFRMQLANHGLLKTYAGEIGEYGIYSYRFSLHLEPVALFDPPDYFLSRFHDIFGRDFSPADRARLEVIDEWDGQAWQPRPLAYTGSSIPIPR